VGLGGAEEQKENHSTDMPEFICWVRNKRHNPLPEPTSRPACIAGALPDFSPRAGYALQRELEFRG